MHVSTFPYIWVNFITTSVRPNPGIMVSLREIIPKIAASFRLVNYYNLPRYMAMDQYLLIPFLGEWTSIYQLFWGSLGTRVLTHPHMSSVFIRWVRHLRVGLAFSELAWPLFTSIDPLPSQRCFTGLRLFLLPYSILTANHRHNITVITDYSNVMIVIYYIWTAIYNVLCHINVILCHIEL